MIKALRSLWPSGISGQIVLLLLATVALSQLIALALVNLSDSRHDPDENLRMQARSIASIVRLISDAPAIDERQAIVVAANRSNPDINLRIISGPGATMPEISREPAPDFLTRDLGPDIIAVTDPRVGNEPRTITIALPDDMYLRVNLPFNSPTPPLLNPRTNTLIFAAIGALALLIWATQVLSSRLRNFAQAVAEYSPDGDHDALPETGPLELRTVAIALNRMRDRIDTLVKNRTMMLTAVGHDLRTPVTRMRLRAEFIENPETRAAILRDLEQMTDMIDAVLSLLRDPSALPAPERVDLASFLQALADDFTDTGRPVDYRGPAHVTARIHEDALRRAVANLVENALHFGTQCRITLRALPDQPYVIEVDDNGPGIPPEERDQMLQPFMRGDSSRSQAHEGFGLGLAIASVITRGHRGTLTLGESDLGGLRVTITLPH
ncbi:two-component sensor histidine kinase [Youhaiella tibetensis]|uniref:histidine kinase n=1 Tax=Paradevosia tibetensis TaxID=1447062 RepID=A0A5B9DQ71_9HYPH|nr:ATP-binding protein [Youhaiella tibetensis]AKR56518.1 Two component sensor histidine kinase [Devosia sp. H5989]QEE21561.1 HAMP domain-containing protein [Youhaiella tibetensis]GGF13878.1 two-component sensor histidine kinase [Youhaiella tibetensis]